MLLVFDKLVASMRHPIASIALERTETDECDMNCLIMSSHRLLYAWRRVSTSALWVYR